MHRLPPDVVCLNTLLVERQQRGGLPNWGFNEPSISNGWLVAGACHRLLALQTAMGLDGVGVA